MSLRFARFLHRMGLSRKKLRGSWLHRRLGDHLFTPNYWKINRTSVARAWLVGIIVAASPTYGFQMILAAVAAFIFRANIPIALGLTWLTNPITMVAYYPAAYWLGCVILGTTKQVINWQSILFVDGIQAFWNTILCIWEPFLLGCTLCGIALGVVGYLAIPLFWKSLFAAKKAVTA